jgi:hypothetical protein
VSGRTIPGLTQARVQPEVADQFRAAPNRSKLPMAAINPMATVTVTPAIVSGRSISASSMRIPCGLTIQGHEVFATQDSAPTASAYDKII